MADVGAAGNEQEARLGDRLSRALFSPGGSDAAGSGAGASSPSAASLSLLGASPRVSRRCCDGRRALPASPGGGLKWPLPHVFVAREEPRPARPEAKSKA